LNDPSDDRRVQFLEHSHPANVAPLESSYAAQL
jgi:hypothetical protein